MYESRDQPPIPREHFYRRMALHALIVMLLLAVSLFVGMAGYVLLEHLSWIDAFINSAMLLGGMGPVDNPRSSGGKLFAGLYALYAGLVFLLAAAVIFAPLLHRIMHLLHWSDRP